MNDPYDLNRFVIAQDPLIEGIRAELHRGRKETHWIWFVFPQLRGLGRSPMAERYGIASRLEAEAYVTHPILGKRLIDCTTLVNRHEDRTVEEIFGFPDDMKFRSCMSLFAVAAPELVCFNFAIDKFFAGVPDPMTLNLLRSR